MAQNKTILVVDDEQDLRDALSDVLTDAGYKTITAENGREGIAKALEHKPDLILLDVMMPELDGFGVLKELRKDPWGKDVKVLLLTALSGIDSVSHGIEAGSNDYLIKTDWKLEDILLKVKQKIAGYD